MKTIVVVAIIILAQYTLSYLSFYNEWEWFWKPVEWLGKLISWIETFVFIKTFPMLIMKYHLNPFSVTPKVLRKTLSDEDKNKFVDSVPKRYRETAKEFFREKIIWD